MKKRINKIWGVGLTLVLAASLLLMAAPVSAGTLSWGDEDIPDLDGNVLEPEDLANDIGGNVIDIAIAGDGSTIYACSSTHEIYRSTNRGESWTTISVIHDTTYVDADLIAVSPDDANYIAVANATSTEVCISDDAGANWDTLGAVNSVTGIDSTSLLWPV